MEMRVIACNATLMDFVYRLSRRTSQQPSLPGGNDGCSPIRRRIHPHPQDPHNTPLPFLTLPILPHLHESMPPRKL